jgi:hypothetical protein
MERRMVAAKVWQWGRGNQDLFNVFRVPILQDEKVLESAHC